ncbi:MAG TPA: hypothetical protein VGN07_16550 [Steroidobacteraceae bacterium]|jgi:hypothetical protein
MLKTIAILLALYGGYALDQGMGGQNYLALVCAVLAFAAAGGLWLRKSWSQYCVYILASGFVFPWLWYTWSVFRRNGPYDTALQGAISLFPGLCMVLFAAGSSVFVFRSFRARGKT